MTKKIIDIDHLAKLARLELTDEEKETLAPQLENILAYVSKLQEVDTSHVPSTASTTNLVNVWREDDVIVCEAAERESAIRSFPDSVGTALKVPGIFDDRTE